ncbi:MAG: hypothetical protein RLP15_00120 [Cryomorphaceae bacterium]
MGYTLKGVNYDVKILLAWGESISGNKKITEFLMKNGYPELGLFHFALRNEERSRDWLMENKFPHLMALINATEGNKGARKWLAEQGFDLLLDMGLSADGDKEAYARLMQSEMKIFAVISKKIESIKDEIEDRKNDPHKFSSAQGGG